MNSSDALRGLVSISMVLAVSLSAAGCGSGSADDGASGASEAVVGESSTPQDIATLDGDPPLAASATHVYFVHHGTQADNADSLRRIPRQGGPEETIFLGAPNDEIEFFVLDGSDVFAVVLHRDDTSDLMRVPVQGGKAIPILPAAQLSNMTMLATDATDVYIANRDRVSRVPKGGALAAEIIADKQEDAVGIALDGGNVYWSTLGKGNAAVGCTPGEGQVHARAKAGGTITTVATGEDCPLWLGYDNGRLYWRTFLGSLRTAPTTGGPASLLAHSMLSFNAAFDADGIYFSGPSPTGLFLFKADKVTSAVTPITATRSTVVEVGISYVVAASGGDLLYVVYDSRTRERKLVRLH